MATRVRSRSSVFRMGIALLCGYLAGEPAIAAGTKRLSGHVPRALERIASIGSVEATNKIQLSLGLPLRNPAGLIQLLEKIYDPDSPYYHHYIRADEFAARFGPTEADYQQVIGFARANGFT